MAKKVAPSLRKKKKSKKGKKTGGGKRALVFILILLILGGAGVYIYYDQISILLLSDDQGLVEGNNENLQMEPEKGEGQVNGIAGTTQKGPLESVQIEVPPPVVKVEKARSSKRFYVKVGSCLYMECQKDFTRGIKQNKYNVYKTKTRKETQYFELISSSGYDKERAKEKQKLLRRFNKRLKPYIIPSGRSYRVSFGSFPDKNKGLEMKAYLAQLYPQINMVFDLEIRKNSYYITNVYAGPFSSNQKAVAARLALRKNSKFLDAFITTRR